MNCEGCGASENTVFHQAGQGVTWCSPLTGCNIDGLVGDMLRALLVSHQKLRPSYDESTDLTIPIHTSHESVRKWVELQLKHLLQEMAEEMGL